MRKIKRNLIKCETCDGWGMLRKNGSRLPASIIFNGAKAGVSDIITCTTCQGTGEIK